MAVCFRSVIAQGTLLALCLMAPACSSDDDLQRNPQYQAGYSAGCQTAHTRVEGFDKTIHRDETMFDASPAYRAGWRSGLSNCGGSTVNRDRNVFGNNDKLGAQH